MTQDYEKLGMFYLGRPLDAEAKKPGEGLLLYDSSDLVTHAVCVGMTGSGKTGLCISLIEEAAIDGIPAILIDPKGDLANLLLTFPDLRPEDFAPWVNPDDARRKGMTIEAFAAQQAALWRDGLAAWGQDGERIRRLRAAADFAIYTPGSDAGLPVSIVSSFGAPPEPVRADGDLLRERVGATVTGLLGLLGIDADPIKSREHILLSTILDDAWRRGTDLDLSGLIRAIQSLPVTRVGVMDVETFFPQKDRFALAMSLNNLLAAPGFRAWLEGEPLDLGRILHARDGKPRVAIFSIAHLSEAERMFFVALLLNQTLAWMRTQSGTTSLRALLYMDEIAGYVPPVANPPSKGPLLTLMKQARAYGLGVVLATQNPVDLDYKGLSNAGTWLIGRLQTERDKARVMDGLEGAAAGAGTKLDRGAMEKILSGLRSRVFLMNNVHEDAPVVFETRWALSYLRGPLTRDQIRRLMAGRSNVSETAALPETTRAAQPAAASPPVSGQAPTSGIADQRPALAPEIPQLFLPRRGEKVEGASIIYVPMVLGLAKLYYADPKAGVDAEEELALLAPLGKGPSGMDWEGAIEAGLAEADLERAPAGDAAFAELPAAAAKAKSYETWKRALQEALFRTRKVALFRSPGLEVVSRAGESERDFRIRLGDVARQERDRLKEALRAKYAPKLAALEDRLRRAKERVSREAEQVKQQKLQTAISFGTTILGAILGRKKMSSSTLGRATTAARGAARTARESEDVARAQESAGAVEAQRAELEAQLAAESEALARRIDPLTEPLEPVAVRPKKANIEVRLVALAWAPHWRKPDGGTTPAWK